MKDNCGMPIDRGETSFHDGLEAVFNKNFPDPLSPSELLHLINQVNQEVAEWLERRIKRPDMKTKAEVVRTLEIAAVLEWSNSGMSTFLDIASPTPDVHIPTERRRLPRRSKAIPPQTVQSRLIVLHK